MNNLTRREKHFIIVLAALMFGTAIVVSAMQINILVFNAWVHAHEPQLILIVGLPLGIYLITEPK